MKLVRLDQVFDIRSGHGLALGNLKKTTPEHGIPFVSRMTANNGVAAYVERVANIAPYAGGELTCALNGEGGVLATFVQDRPYYTAFHIACLRPKTNLSTAHLIYYCRCIWVNHYRYSWGRQANRTLKNIMIPDPNEIPSWAQESEIERFTRSKEPLIAQTIELSDTSSWQWHRLGNLFDIERGRGPRKKDLNGHGETPFITSTDSNNGLTGVTTMKPCHKGNTLGVNRNGSVGEAFYQPVAFCSTEDVHVFVPKFQLNPYTALFLTTLIRRERYRFGYGRKWGIERMKQSKLKLPTNNDGTPDWNFMERYIKTLPFSSQL